MTTTPKDKEWAALRQELARQAGIAIFIGGAKLSDGLPVPADGVEREFEFAKAAGVFVLPIGATGGTAEQISNQLQGSELPSKGSSPMRPTDKELKALADPAALATAEGRVALVNLVFQIIDRVARVG
ncbi:hypothetical protein [Pseudomonas congelans]|uniref:hypothetical protein n=1 Tax=Pseudomonas congelans TaxID=200452 RepID=UPI001F3133F5|nr:hypothetical protein [Pseudomonas congelans]